MFNPLKKWLHWINTYLNTQSVPRSKHSSGYKNQSANAVQGNNCLFFPPGIRRQHINTQCETHAISRNVKPGGSWRPSPYSPDSDYATVRTTESKPAPSPTQAPRIPSALPPDLKQRESEADHSSPSSVLFSNAQRLDSEDRGLIFYL